MKKCHDRTSKLFDNIRKFFETTVPGWVDQNVVPILNFVEGLKAIEEGVAVVFSVVFPKVPPHIFEQIDKYLDEICQALRIEISCANNSDGSPASLETRLACVASYLKTLHPELRHALQIRLASWLTRVTAGEHQFTAAQIDAIVQVTYSQEKHEKTPAPEDNSAQIAALEAKKKEAIARTEQMLRALKDAPIEAVDNIKHEYWKSQGLDFDEIDGLADVDFDSEGAEAIVASLDVNAVHNPTNAPDEALTDPAHEHWTLPNTDTDDKQTA